MIRLSICIATLNRAKFIGETLMSILSQMTEEMEIVVVDGASTDGTDAVVTEIFRNRDRCIYHRLPEKGGVDQDYCKSVEIASGEYCWLFPDDDIISPGGIEVVLCHLQKKPDLVIVNADVRSLDLKEILLPRKALSDQDRVFTPDQQAELLACAGNYLAFIGGVVMRRETWLARDPKPYLGSEFIHVGMIFQKKFERDAIVIAQPLINIRNGNSLWRGRAFNIWMFQWPGVIWSFAHLPDSAKRAVIPREPWKTTRGLLMMKGRGCFTYADYLAKIAPRPMSFLQRCRAWMIARFPEVACNALLSWMFAVLMPYRKDYRYDLRDSPFDYRKHWFPWNRHLTKSS